MKKIRWFLGFSFLAVLLLFIVSRPVRSLLAWQSDFVSRCFFIFMLCFALCLSKIVFSRRPGGRVAAISALGILIVGLCATLSIATGRDCYLDIAIAWALQGFIGVLAFAKYLEGKGFDD